MVLYIFVTCLVVFLGWFVNSDYRRKVTNQGLRNYGTTRQEFINRTFLTAIFAVLFALSALRVGTGNDYWVYRTGFLMINGGETPVAYEFGFKALVLIMQKLFYRDCYIQIFALCAFIIAILFVKGLYDTSDWFFYTMFLFMANGFYFMSFSNVRYYMAIGICICAMKPLLEKRYVAFVVCILLAALFHKTAIIAIPVYLVAYFVKWNKKTLWLIPAAIAILIAGRSIIRWFLFKIYRFYEGDPLDTSRISVINIAKCGAILIFCLIYYKKYIEKDSKAEFLFNLNLGAFLLYTFAYYIPEITRVCYYMVIGQVFLIPLLLKKIEDKRQKRFFGITIFIAYVLYFAVFLKRGSEPGINILPYLSWIFG